jgi:hypothetical protein
MAMNIHVARVAFLAVDALGNVVSKDSITNTISMQLSGSHEHRILQDDTIPNTVNNPTVKRYLELEAAANYVLQYMDQNSVITYLRTAGGGFA